MPDERSAHYGSTDYLRRDEKRRRGHEARDRKFIEAIMDEEAKKGHPISWSQARRELERQTRVSQRELLWQEHRTTLTDYTPQGPRDREIKQKVEKRMGRPSITEVTQLQEIIASQAEQIEALMRTIETNNAEFQRYKKEHP